MNEQSFQKAVSEQLKRNPKWLTGLLETAAVNAAGFHEAAQKENNCNLNQFATFLFSALIDNLERLTKRQQAIIKMKLNSQFAIETYKILNLEHPSHSMAVAQSWKTFVEHYKTL